MKRRSVLLSCLSFLALSICLLQAQSSSSHSAPAALRFTASVLDPQGTPIRDLRSEDFVVEVSGKVWPAQVQLPSVLATAGAHDASNGRGLVVIVIDTIHTVWIEEKDLRLAAGKYLAACAKRNLPVTLAILNRSGALVPVHEYTTGSATLAAALEQVDAEMHHRPSAPDASPEAVAEGRRFMDFYKGAGNFPSGRAMRADPDAILDGFSTVARYVAGIPGRKSLIWVGSFIPFAVEEKQGRIASYTRPVGSIAADTVEEINPDVLTPDQVKRLQIRWKESIGAVQRSELALNPVLARTTAGNVDTKGLKTMAGLARITGGLEVHSVGDPFGQFADSQQNNLAAYEILLSADASQGCTNDWCELKITVKRDGARALVPEGFFRDTNIVQPETRAAATPTSTEPPDPNGILFTVNWKPAEDSGSNKKKIAFVVTFGPNAGIPTQGSAELDVEVMVHAFADGTDKQGVSFGAKAQLPPQKVDEIRSKGFALNNSIELEPGDYEVRFIVHDKVSGRLGMIKVPLKVV
jgi:VWFA-related protein